MKLCVTSPEKPFREAGNVLIMTIVLTSIIGMTLAAYMTMVNTQYRLTQRAQNWNGLIPTVEAGLEEAMAHLNSIGGVTNRALNGWTDRSNGVFMARTLGENRFEVFIGPGESPTIWSTGYGKAPTTTTEVARSVAVTTSKLSGMWLGMVARGDIVLGPGSLIDSFNSGNPNLSTNGKYDPSKKNDKTFVGAVNGMVASAGADIFGTVGTGPAGFSFGNNVGDMAWLTGGGTGIQPGHWKNDLNMSFPDAQAPFSSASPATGGTAITESYTYSSNAVTVATLPNPLPTGGITTNSIVNVVNVFPDPVPAGGVATNTLPFTVSAWPGASNLPITTNTIAVVGQSTVPTTGTYLPPFSIITNSVTTTTTGQGKGKGNTTTTTSSTFSYNQITDYTYTTTTYTYTTTNFTYSALTTVTNYTTNTVSMVLGSGNYMNSSVSLSGQNEIVVTGDAVWYVPGDFSLSGNSSLTVAPGASLQLYVGGSTMTISGNGAVNLNNDARSMQVWGLPTLSRVKLAGNAEFIGTIYAPSATLIGAGGGNDTQDVAGAVIVGGVNYNGHFGFHYDERLGNDAANIKFRLASWNEY